MKSIFKKSIVFIILLCTIFSCSIFFNAKEEQSVLAYTDKVYSTYASLYNSYEDFSYDYNNEVLPTSYCMRDEYMLYAQQQSELGLCWCFTGQTCLQTTILKKTKEYLDFSEAWVSAALVYGTKNNIHPNLDLIESQYINGSGGNFIGYDVTVKNFGLVLEQDFKYDYSYEVTTENVNQYYEMYSQYANFDFIDNLQAGRFSVYNSRSDKETIIKSMKNHIVQNGSIYAGASFYDFAAATYKSKTIYYKIPSINTTSGHAMSIIGWDDNVTVTYNSVTYKGAWIALNSYGNSIESTRGDEGIVYLMYDDTNFNAFFGYKYVEEDLTESFNYHDEIKSSNASYTTSLKNAYHGTFNATTQSTQQRNIFFNQNDVNISYEYKLGSDTTLTDVLLYKGGVDLTYLITPQIDEDEKTISISGTNLSTGTYKVIINFTNGTTTDQHINQFFVCDGTEINYTYFNTSDSIMPGNGRYQLYNIYNCDEETILYATTSNSSIRFSFYIYFATYNTVSEVKMGASVYTPENTATLNKNYIGLSFFYDTMTSGDFEIKIKSTSGAEKTLKLKILKTSATNNLFTQMNYDSNGGDNSTNQKKLVVNKTNGAVLENPTKPGYIFEGWYYSEDFLETSKLSTNAVGKYVYEYSKVKTETSPNVYYKDYSFSNYWQRINVGFVYAKWADTESIVTFITNGGTSVEPLTINYGEKISMPETSKEGFDFIGWYKDSSFTTLWNFDTDCVYRETKLYAKFQIKNATNIVLSIESPNQYVGEQFLLSASFDHVIKDSVSVRYEWYRNNGIIATTTTNTYTETVTAKGDYKYKVIVCVSKDSSTSKSSSIETDVSVIYRLTQISISHSKDLTFIITDTDSYESTYNISIYKNSEKYRTFSTQDKTVNLEIYIQESGVYYITVIKKIDDQQLEEVQSSSIEVFELSFSNVPYSSQYILKDNYISAPESPTKTGFTFDGWYINSTKCEFPLQITTNISLSATFKLNEISSVTLTVGETQYVGQSFSLTLNYVHEVLFGGEYSIEWYKDNVIIDTTTTKIFSHTINNSGTFEFYAIIYFTVDGQTVDKSTEKVSVNVVYQLNKITLYYNNNGEFGIIDNDAFESDYEIILYKDNSQIATFTTKLKMVNVSDRFNGSGVYKISVTKSFEGYSLAPVNSKNITIVTISFENLADYTYHATMYVDKGYTLYEIIEPIKTGYTLKQWKVNGYTVGFPYKVNQDTIFIAEWQLKQLSNVSLSTQNDIRENRAFNITFNYEHELKENAQITVSWYKDETIISTTNTNVLTQTNTAGTYSYYAKITAIIDGQTLTATASAIDIKVRVVLTQITVTHIANTGFIITDNDSYESSYTVNVYKNDANIGTYTSTNKVLNISAYVTSSGEYKIIVEKSYDGETLEGVESVVVTIYEITFSNIEDTTAHPTTYVESNTSIESFIEPIKTGYDFNCWKIGGNKVVFPYIVNSNVQFVANWKLKSLENVKLETNLNQNTDIAFNIKIVYEHDLKENAEISVEWYKDSEKITTTAIDNISQTIFESGDYKYYAIIKFIVGSEFVTSTTEEINIKVIYKLTQILINYKGNCVFEIQDSDLYKSTYNILIYEKNNKIAELSTQEKLINITSYIQFSSFYKINVTKTYKQDSLTSVESDFIEVCQVSYSNMDNTQDYPTSYVDKGYKFTNIQNPVKLGYSFKEWMANSLTISLPYEINEDTQFVAKWQLKEITSAQLSANEKSFINTSFDITLSYVHELENLALEIEWYYNNNIIDKTTRLSISQTIDSRGVCEYYAILKLTDGVDVVSATTEPISIKICEILSQITINYLNEGLFEIIDLDKFESIYTVIEYKNDQQIQTYTQQTKTVDISKNIKSDGVYKISVVKTFDNESLENVFSQNVDIYKISYSDLEDYTNYQDKFVDKGYSLESPKLPTKKGYNFDCWKVENIQCEFPITINKNTQICATWLLKDIKNIIISAQTTQFVNQEFDLTLDYEHELKPNLQTSIDWYKNDEFLLTSQELKINQTISESVDVEYYAILTITENENSKSGTSNRIKINIIFKLNQIEVLYHGNCAYEIQDPDSYNSTYEIGIVLENETVLTYEITDKIFNVRKYIEQYGKGVYKVEITKTFNGQKLDKITSDQLQIHKVTIIKSIYKSSEYATLLVENGSALQKPEDVKEKGYLFYGWYKDINNTQSFKFPVTVNSDLQMYAKLILKPLTVECTKSITVTYNNQEQIIAPVITHELVGGEFDCVWSKNGDDSFICDTKDLILKEVKDSGEYSCVITYTYQGDTVNANINNVVVKIDKAPTILDTSNIKTEYTYDGQNHKIEGAKVDRENELPTIKYSNNEFKDVPKNHSLKIKIEVMPTANYLGCEEYVDIIINKAQAVLEMEIYQTFTYSSQIIRPDYILNNKEQEVEFSQSPINVGRYENIVVTVKENTNYFGCEKSTTINITPQKVVLKVKDTTGLWLIGAPFSYDVVEGVLYDGDEINEQYFCDGKNDVIGTSTISMTASNPNYQIEIIDGTYTITVIPHIALGGTIIVILLMIITIKKVKSSKGKKEAFETLLNAKNIQDKNAAMQEINVEQKNDEKQSDILKNIQINQTVKNSTANDNNILKSIQTNKINNVSSVSNSKNEIDDFLQELLNKERLNKQVVNQPKPQQVKQPPKVDILQKPVSTSPARPQQVKQPPISTNPAQKSTPLKVPPKPPQVNQVPPKPPQKQMPPKPPQLKK